MVGIRVSGNPGILCLVSNAAGYFRKFYEYHLMTENIKYHNTLQVETNKAMCYLLEVERISLQAQQKLPQSMLLACKNTSIKSTKHMTTRAGRIANFSS